MSEPSINKTATITKTAKIKKIQIKPSNMISNNITNTFKKIQNIKLNTNNFAFTINDISFQIDFNHLCKNTSESIILHAKKGSEKLSMIISVNCNENKLTESFANLNIMYKEPSYSSDKYSQFKKEKQGDKEILIIRSLDKMIRPILQNMLHITLSVNILTIENSDHIDVIFCGAIGLLVCLKKIFDINIGLYRSFSHKDQIKNFTIVTNKENIYNLELECSPATSKELDTCIKNAIEFCSEICELLNLIPSKNKIIIDHKLVALNKKKTIEENITSLKESKLYSIETIRKSVSAFLCVNKIRIDNNRKLEELRKISVEHGHAEKSNSSVIFKREGQNGSTIVLGVSQVTGNKANNYDKHESSLTSYYNFYNFATGGSGYKNITRREVSHADLIRSAIQNVLNKDSCLKVYTEVLCADGSTSMAGTSAVSTALVLGGLLDNIVGGVSIGLLRKNKQELLFVDMTAEEDNYSEMDLKITGLKSGQITAIKLDCKSYISIKSIKKAILLGQKSIQKVIEIIESYKLTPKQQMINSQISKDMLGAFIGKNGTNIRRVEKFIKAKVQVSKDGFFSAIIDEHSNIDLLNLILKFYTQSSFKEKEIVACFAKDDFNGHDINIVTGTLINDKKITGKAEDLLVFSVKNWSKKEIKIQKIYPYSEV